jgi:hypothetical protein
MLKERSDHEHAPIISPITKADQMLPIKSKMDLNLEDANDGNLL